MFLLSGARALTSRFSNQKFDLEVKGLNIDQVNEEDRQRRLAKKFGGGGE